MSLFSKQVIEESPSRRDGMSFEEEREHRRTYCSFIQKIGEILSLPQVTISTAMVYCHRFFMRYSQRSQDKYAVAAACLYLASKVEETVRSAEDVLYYMIAFQTDPNENVELLKKLKGDKEFCNKEKWKLFSNEMDVLSTLNFEVSVAHPYKPLVTAINELNRTHRDFDEGAVCQVAWGILNETVRTTLSLVHRPDHIALAAISLACKLLKIPVQCSTLYAKAELPLALYKEIFIDLLSIYEESLPPEPAIPFSKHAPVAPLGLSLKNASLDNDPTINPAKLKAAREKRRREQSRLQAPSELQKVAVTDEELLEQELEFGVEQEAARDKTVSGSPRKRARTTEPVPDNSFRIRERSRDRRSRDDDMKSEKSFGERRFEIERKRPRSPERRVDDRFRREIRSRDYGNRGGDYGRYTDRSFGRLPEQRRGIDEKPVEKPTELDFPEEGELPPEPEQEFVYKRDRKMLSYDEDVRGYDDNMRTARYDYGDDYRRRDFSDRGEFRGRMPDFRNRVDYRDRNDFRDRADLRGRGGYYHNRRDDMDNRYYSQEAQWGDYWNGNDRYGGR